MTQYLNEILAGKERLSEEKIDKLVTSLYRHKTKDEDYWLTRFASGRTVKEFTDKRKKDEVTYG
tara:strand:+ start:1133 stop:1324 length:192 start_codon:yes stop_codon:yes gene_type:complete